MNKEYLQKFGKNLRKIRKSKGFVQEDFTGDEGEGISRSMIGMLETARTDLTLTTLKIIADALEVKPKDLLDFE